MHKVHVVHVMHVYVSIYYFMCTGRLNRRNILQYEKNVMLYIVRFKDDRLMRDISISLVLGKREFASQVS